MPEQSNNTDLCPVISVDKEKCVNCHACIGVCPVKYCNNASNVDEGITINQNLCIGCGACLRACSHEARVIVDDTERFFSDLKQGATIGTLVAPAAAVNFPDQLLHLMGWLKTLNVKMNFDVSFGAEIATYQYVQLLKNGATRPIIAQPCPSIVSYIEIYQPQLLKYLAPTGSPALDMAAWVHERYPGMKLAFISPCIAKSREFSDPNTKGLVSYNVTIANLKKYLTKNQINLSDFTEANFDGPLEAERALLFSQPGGLGETLKRYQIPLKLHQLRRVEGPEVFEEFFKELETELKNQTCDLIVIDVLNCLHGCNRGTGTNYDERTTDEILRIQAERLEQHQQNYYPNVESLKELEQRLEEITGELDFTRNYSDKSKFYMELLEPTTEMIEIMHLEMKKTTKKDIANCRACGYDSCEKMAKAILNGLYRPEQCNHYLKKFYDEKNTEK